MAKPERCDKQVCQSCAAKFYDLNRSHNTCPKCAARFDPEALLKSRRSRPAPPARVAKPEPKEDATKAAGNPPENDGKLDDVGEAAGRPGDNDDDDDSVLQDTSELGGGDESGVAITGGDGDDS